MTEDEYLENCLEAKSKQKEDVWKSLKTFFKNWSCFTLVWPSDDERDIQNFKNDITAIKPEFKT